MFDLFSIFCININNNKGDDMNNMQLNQFEKAKTHAISKGGECLSNEYLNSREKMIWKCANHEHKSWMACFGKVVSSGRWCPECATERIGKTNKNKDGLNKAKNYAKSKGGQCLSNIYIGATEKMIWKCANPEHEPWESSYNKIVNTKHWCPECGKYSYMEKQKNKDGLEIAKNYAILNGGHCLSIEYKNNHTKLEWKCHNENHKSWKSSYSTVVSSNSWCPECSKNSLSEKRTRLIFEKFFGKDFPSVKPTWNINPWTNKPLELDGYCKEFNVAFEYDGQHHFKITNYNGSDKKKKDLTYQQFKDYQKQKNCIKQGVLLIKIKFIRHKYAHKFDVFLKNIVDSCKEQGVALEFNKEQLISLEIEFNSMK